MKAPLSWPLGSPECRKRLCSVLSSFQCPHSVGRPQLFPSAYLQGFQGSSPGQEGCLAREALPLSSPAQAPSQELPWRDASEWAVPWASCEGPVVTVRGLVPRVTPSVCFTSGGRKSPTWPRRVNSYFRPIPLPLPHSSRRKNGNALYL